MNSPLRSIKVEVPSWLSGLQRDVKQGLERLGAVVRANTAAIEKAVAHVEATTREFRESLAALGRATAELPKRYRDQLGVLAQNGWYLDFDMPFTAPAELAKAFLSGSATEAEAALCDYYDTTVGDIEARLAVEHPTRRGVLGAAFRAHRDTCYYLSVPVFLAQADGIANELLSRQVFSRAHAKRVTEQVISSLAADPLGASILAPLAMNLPISAGPQERAPGSLNRHAVLHGEDVSYGTRTNSCRAMSLIAYTSFVHKVVAEGRSKPV